MVVGSVENQQTSIWISMVDIDQIILKSRCATCHDVFWCGVALCAHDARRYMGVISFWTIFCKPKIRKFSCVGLIFWTNFSMDLLIDMKTNTIKQRLQSGEVAYRV